MYTVQRIPKTKSALTEGNGVKVSRNVPNSVLPIEQNFDVNCKNLLGVPNHWEYQITVTTALTRKAKLVLPALKAKVEATP